MSAERQSIEAVLSPMRDAMQGERYQLGTIAQYLGNARLFLHHLVRNRLNLNDVRPSDVVAYLAEQQQQYQRKHGRPPRSADSCRNMHLRAIERLLRTHRSDWPPAGTQDPVSAWVRTLREEYERWLCDVRGLAPTSIRAMSFAAGRFMAWWAQHCGAADVDQLSFADIDDYQKLRSGALSRVSCKILAGELRAFLTFLHATGHLARNLAPDVMSSSLYANEGIPSTLPQEDVVRLLASTSEDCSAIGRRDHAMVLLLSTYGMRAGEVRRLQIEDIDWRRDLLWIVRSKSCERSCLPLVPAVGDAILAYLKEGRPATDAREVFVRERAPYRGLGSIYMPVWRRMQRAGIQPSGKHGPHLLRHARAVSMLHASMSIKQIGDLFGHRSEAATRPYLKLAANDLRAVALEIPTHKEKP